MFHRTALVVVVVLVETLKSMYVCMYVWCSAGDLNSNGEMHGYGTFIYANGDIYEGYWVHDKVIRIHTYIYIAYAYTFFLTISLPLEIRLRCDEVSAQRTL